MSQDTPPEIKLTLDEVNACSSISQLAKTLIHKHAHYQRIHLVYSFSADLAHKLATCLKAQSKHKHFVVIGYTTSIFLNLNLKKRYQYRGEVMCGETIDTMHPPQKNERCYFDGSANALSSEFQHRYNWCEQAIQILKFHLAQWPTGTAKAIALQEIIDLCQSYLYQHDFNQVYGLLTCCVSPALSVRLFEQPIMELSSYNKFHQQLAKRRYLPGIAPTVLEIRDHLMAGQASFEEINTRQCLQELIHKLTLRQRTWNADTDKYNALTQLIRRLDKTLSKDQLQDSYNAIRQGLENKTLTTHKHPHWDRFFFRRKTTTEKILHETQTKLEQYQNRLSPKH